MRNHAKLSSATPAFLVVSVKLCPQEVVDTNINNWNTPYLNVIDINRISVTKIMFNNKKILLKD